MIEIGKLLLFLGISSVLMLSCGHDTNFEGVIHYNVRYELPEADSALQHHVEAIFGNERIMYIDDSRIKFELNGTGYSSIYYDTVGSNVYTQNVNGDTTYRLDYLNSSITDSILEVVEGNGSFKIAGHVCKQVQIKTQLSSYSVMYDPRLEVESPAFIGMQLEGFGQALVAVGAVPLYLKYHAYGYTIILTAVSIDEQILDDDVFDIDTSGVVLKGL